MKTWAEHLGFDHSCFFSSSVDGALDAPIISVLTKWLENVAFSEFFEAMLRMVGSWEVQLHKGKRGTRKEPGSLPSTNVYHCFFRKRNVALVV